MARYTVAYSWETEIEAGSEEEAQEQGYTELLDNLGACDLDVEEIEEDKE